MMYRKRPKIERAESMPAIAGARSVSASAGAKSSAVSVGALNECKGGWIQRRTSVGVSVLVSCTIEGRSQAKDLLPTVRRVDDHIERALVLRRERQEDDKRQHGFGAQVVTQRRTQWTVKGTPREVRLYGPTSPWATRSILGARYDEREGGEAGAKAREGRRNVGTGAPLREEKQGVSDGGQDPVDAGSSRKGLTLARWVEVWRRSSGGRHGGREDGRREGKQEALL
jgi:hypothetical protein